MDNRMRAWKIVTAVGIILIVGYFHLPNVTSQDVEYSIIGAASVGLILLGVHLYTPKNRFAWFCIAAAGAFFTLGDDVYSFYSIILHLNVPFPSYADALYLSGYPFLFIGVLSLARSTNYFSQREDTADAAIVSLGVLAISWHFLMNTYFNNLTVSTFGLFVNMAYPVMDIGLHLVSHNVLPAVVEP
jgi:multisubunit Na+/H+ antiporter MnhG subunit